MEGQPLGRRNNLFPESTMVQLLRQRLQIQL